MEEKTQVELQFQNPAWIPSTPLRPISPTTRLICQRIQEKEVSKDGSSGSGLSKPGFASADYDGSCTGAGKGCTLSDSATAADVAVTGFTVEGATVTGDAGLDWSRQPWLTVNQPTTCTDGTTKSGGYVCDLNKLPRNEEDEVPVGSIPPVFAPITPNKAPPKSDKGDERKHEDDKEVTKNALSGEVGDPSNGETQHDSSEKTPRRQKARRKKHRPKVVKEGKKQRMQRTKAVSTEKPLVKRKYVRRKDIGKSACLGNQMTGEPSNQQNQAKNRVQIIHPEQRSASSAEKLPINREYVRKKANRKSESLDDQATGESTDQENPLKKTCRKALNFDKSEQPREEAVVYQSTEKHKDSVPDETSKPISTEHSSEHHRSSSESTNVENHCSNAQMQKSGMSATEDKLQPEKSDTCFRNGFLRFTHVFVRRPKSNAAFINPDGQSYCSSISQINVQSNNSSEVYKAMAGAEFPEVTKETRTENVLLGSTTRETKMPCDAVVEQSHCFASMGNGLVDIPQIMSDGSSKVEETRREFQGRKQLFGCELQLGQRDWLTKKRSRVPIRVRDLSSLSITGNGMPNHPSKQSLTGSEAPTTCMEALLTDIQGTLSRKKRTKKELSETYSTYSCAATQDNPDLYGSVQSGESACNHPSGARSECRKSVLFIDALVKKLEHLDINKESSGNSHGQLALICHDMANQERAIAIYNRDGPIMSVPPKKKRRPRAKVELDDETTRVWKLLFKNIRNEATDGTDEDKERWWEEERGVFKGRADSFIARMHLVQGDRRFSPWKGSVVDSVIGVFLTQNVSDHLSSSAFMSLASRFPSKLNQEECYEEEQGPSFYDPDELRQVIKYPRSWTHYMFNQSLSDQQSIIINEVGQNEETEVVNNNAHIGRENGSFSWQSGSQSRLTGLHGSALELSVYFTSKSSADVLQDDAYRLTEGCFQENDSHSSPNSNVTSQNSEDYISTQNASKGGASIE